MTSQQEANAALAIYRANKHEPRAVAESLLDQFFASIRPDEYEDQLNMVQECMQ